jgi:hypothetical protein
MLQIGKLEIGKAKDLSAHIRIYIFQSNEEMGILSYIYIRN